MAFPLPFLMALLTTLALVIPPPLAAAAAAPPSKKKPRPAPEREEPTKPEPSPTPTTKSAGAANPAATSTLAVEDLQGFSAQPEPVRRLLTAALELTKRNLTYTYGSADPSAGGMDCSGTIHYLLKSNGFPDVPRQANEQYVWVRKSGRFQAVLSHRADSFELDNLHPGDLLFWTGTYKVDRDPPVTHTMIFLGKRKADGKPLMVGASDGRSYDGQRRNGVSVFDFKLPAARSGDTADASTAAAPDRAPNFAGYGPVPGMNSPAAAAPSASPPPAEKPSEEPTPRPNARKKRRDG